MKCRMCRKEGAVKIDLFQRVHPLEHKPEVSGDMELVSLNACPACWGELQANIANAIKMKIVASDISHIKLSGAEA